MTQLFIIHRPYAGDHQTDSPDCWCDPVIKQTEEGIEGAIKPGDLLLEQAQPRPN